MCIDSITNSPNTAAQDDNKENKRHRQENNKQTNKQTPPLKMTTRRIKGTDKKTTTRTAPVPHG